ncbi:uncharacterized protein LOC118406641 isoform X1 [Branchiostoma floridae]|uniref:Uncharacterized protein LOC118406641 isoform X1 n=1 Tax=Branchiostoma floridae TaxID=7739 RepID=A0A9J7KK32_BRAFL|nr:uncharacterized protein LOC118406641 isoform X1 [Branchiostoma floridae]
MRLTMCNTEIKSFLTKRHLFCTHKAKTAPPAHISQKCGWTGSDVTRGIPGTAGKTSTLLQTTFLSQRQLSLPSLLFPSLCNFFVMVKRCVAFGCSNTSRLGFSLHKFPQTPWRRRQWERFVQRRRAQWTVGACSYLCSKHFSVKQFYGGLESQFGLDRRAKLQKTACPDILDAADADGSAGREGASSARRSAVEKLNNHRIIADLLEDHESEARGTVEIEDEQLESAQDAGHMDVGVQTKQSVRNQGTQVTPGKADVGIQCMLLCPEHHTHMQEDEEEEEEEDEEEEDDDDDEYFPTEEELLGAKSDDEDFDLEWETHEGNTDTPPPPHRERKYLVFESALLQLFTLCLLCGGAVNLTLDTAGSFLQVTQVCKLCKFVRKWSSQPFIGNTPAGNLLMSAAILFAGAIPKQALHMFRHLSCQCVSIRTFFRHQRLYLHSAIQNVWQAQQDGLLNSAVQPLILGGDGRADSPGHSAKFGSYTLMDLRTSKILTIQLVQSNEVAGGSNNMEKEGLVRAVAFLQARGLQISTLVTDRHLQVAKWVRENLPATRHLYDIWHIAKGIRKKLSALGRQKECELVIAWIQSIINHLYWCATTTREGEGELLAAKWASLDNHLHNVHRGHSQLFPRCEHGRVARRRQWLQPNTKASVKLTDIINKKALLRDIKKLSNKYQTATLEAFHSLINHFAPKWASFSYWGMLSRLYLAVLHSNENCGRPQLETKEGDKVFKLRFKKFKKACTVQEVVGDCTFDYVTVLMEETIRICDAGEEAHLVQPPPTLASAFDRPEKEAAVDAHRTRFGRNDD